MSRWASGLVLVGVQVGFLIAFRPPFLSDWDSYLYSYAALKFEPVSLGLGRWFYCGFLGVVWRLAGWAVAWDVGASWRVFAGCSTLLAVVNVLLVYRVGQRWVGRREGFVGACIVGCSGMIAYYGGSVMTETLVLTLLLVSILLVGGRGGIGWVLVGGAVFGAACSMREPLVLLAPIHVALLWDRSGRAGGVVMFVGAAVLMVLAACCGAYLGGDGWVEQLRSWSAAMGDERRTMGAGLAGMLGRNVCFYVVFLTLFSPLIVFTVPGQVRWVRAHRSRWSVGVIAGIVLYSLAEIFNHTLVFNPRFVIFPGVLMSIVAGAVIVGGLESCGIRSLWAGVLVVGFHVAVTVLFMPVVDEYCFEKSQASSEVFATVGPVSDEAVIMPGKLTPVVDYYQRLYGRAWRVVHAGWSFDSGQIDDAVRLGRKGKVRILLVERKYWPSVIHRSQQYCAYERLYGGGWGVNRSEVAGFVEVVVDDRDGGRRSRGTSTRPAASRSAATGGG